MQILLTHYSGNNIIDWAKNNLNPQEHLQFEAAYAANSSLWQSYMDQGLYTEKEIFQTFYSALLDTDIQIAVGKQITMAQGFTFDDLKLDTSYKEWVLRYGNETGGDLLTPLVS